MLLLADNTQQFHPHQCTRWGFYFKPMKQGKEPKEPQFNASLCRHCGLRPAIPLSEDGYSTCWEVGCFPCVMTHWLIATSLRPCGYGIAGQVFFEPKHSHKVPEQVRHCCGYLFTFSQWQRFFSSYIVMGLGVCWSYCDWLLSLWLCDCKSRFVNLNMRPQQCGGTSPPL